MLTKEPEMLEPDAFCKHTMQQNATPLPRGRGRKGRGREGRGREREREERGREEGKGRGGEIDSDAHLEQGRRLAKIGPETECVLV